MAALTPGRWRRLAVASLEMLQGLAVSGATRVCRVSPPEPARNSAGGGHRLGAEEMSCESGGPGWALDRQLRATSPPMSRAPMSSGSAAPDPRMGGGRPLAPQLPFPSYARCSPRGQARGVGCLPEMPAFLDTEAVLVSCSPRRRWGGTARLGRGQHLQGLRGRDGSSFPEQGSSLGLCWAPRWDPSQAAHLCAAVLH